MSPYTCIYSVSTDSVQDQGQDNSTMTKACYKSDIQREDNFSEPLMDTGKRE